MKKSFLILFFISCLSLLLEASEDVNLNKIYKIGLPDVPGFMFTDENGNPQGLPLEVLQKALDDANIQYEWVQGSWHELYHKAQKNEIDLLPGALKIEDREDYFDFCDENLYLMWSEVFINEETDYYHIKDFENKKIGLVYDDYNAKELEKYFEDFHIEYEKIYFESHEEAAEAVRNGEIFGMAGPNPNVLDDILIGIKRSGLYFNPNYVTYAFPKGQNTELRNYLDMKLKSFKQNPKSIYNDLINKYRISHITPQQPFIPDWLAYSLIAAVILIVFSVLFIWLLQNRIKSKTKELRHNQDMLANALELGKMGLWSIDIKKQTVFRSENMLKLIGLKGKARSFSFDEMMKFIHSDDRDYVNMIIQNTIENDENFSVEMRMLDVKGNLIHTLQIGYLVKDSEGNPVEIVGITQDITERKNYEFELIKAKEKAEESEKLKSAFLANMSHEIRTPLNAIVGFSSLLIDESADADEKSSFAQIITKQNELLLNLINDIIDFAKIESGSLQINNKEINDYNEIINEVYESFKPKIPNTNIEFIKNINKTDETTINADPIRLRQVIINFVSNAIKNTEKGFIEIGSRINEESKKLEIYVKDSGAGIPKDKQKEIFDRFSQLNIHNQGTGLGLSICKYLAEQMNAEIILNSEVGVGSEFIISMNYSTTETSSKVSSPKIVHKIENETNKFSKILIAEDINSNYLLLKSILKNDNYHLFRANTGKEAVEFFKKDNFNIVLMDLKMPVMDGLEATKQIKRINSKVPIIAVTAYALENEKEKAIAAGCDDIITKPIDKDDLINKINFYLH